MAKAETKNGKPQGPDTPADDTAAQAAPVAAAAPPDPPAAEPTTITMVFPHRVVLNVGARSHLEFNEGPNEVPVDVAKEYAWYLKNHGVTPYVKKGAKKQ